MLTLPLVPIASWAFEHLIARINAASLISIVFVARDEVKSELISRFKDKNPTFIYRTGSGNGTNMTPRITDLDGLSYTLTMLSKRPRDCEILAPLLLPSTQYGGGFFIYIEINALL